MTTIGIRDFLFDGREGENVRYTIEKITGLDGLDMRREKSERPLGDGDFPEPGYLEGRLVTFQGLCFTNSPAAQEQEQLRLSGLLAGRGHERVSFALPSGRVLWGDFGRYSKPRFEPELWGETASYQVSMYSPDPILYGETHEFSGNNGVTFLASHDGNTDAELELQVIGNQGDPYTIEALGREFIVSQDLLPGQTHRLFPSSGQLVIDDQVVAGGLVSAPPIMLPPGVETPFRLVSPNLSNLKVIAEDSYA